MGIGMLQCKWIPKSKYRTHYWQFEKTIVHCPNLLLPERK